MDRLEKILAQLASTPIHPGLDRLDEAVLAGLTAHNRRAAAAHSVRLLGLGALAALSFGIFNAGLPSPAAASDSPIVSLGPLHALAPSSLLLGPR